MRLRVLVLFACLLAGGVPAVVFFTIKRAETGGGAWSGEQPGGILRGAVRDEDGRALAGALVEVRAGRRKSRRSGHASFVVSRDALDFDETHTVRVETGAEGLFEVAVDPLDGVYALNALADGFEPCERLYSFLDGQGRVLAIAPTASFELARSVRLIVELESKDGGELAGRYELEPAARGAASGGDARVERGEFAGREIVLDRLAPGRARLELSTRDGRRFATEVELARGTLTLRVRL